MHFVIAAEHPDLHPQAAEAFREKWPEFIFHDQVPARYLPRAEDYFSGYNLLLLDGDAGGVFEPRTVVAGGWGVPFAWDGTIEDLPDGFNSALIRAVEGYEAGTPATAFSFMAAAVAPGKHGLARPVLGELTRRAVANGLTRVVAPLRPTWKHRYPTVPMDQYATWTHTDGYAFDPWIRTHQKMGATMLGTAPRSMQIEGSVADWEKWADMPFPATGDYVVPGALSLVHIDREADRGVYVEENLWVQHR